MRIFGRLSCLDLFALVFSYYILLGCSTRCKGGGLNLSSSVKPWDLCWCIGTLSFFTLLAFPVLGFFSTHTDHLLTCDCSPSPSAPTYIVLSPPPSTLKLPHPHDMSTDAYALGVPRCLSQPPGLQFPHPMHMPISRTCLALHSANMRPGACITDAIRLHSCLQQF